MKHKFEVLKSTASSNGGFVNTLVVSLTSTRFGVKNTTKHRFMMKTTETLEVGATEDLDLQEFEIIERETEFVNKQTGELMKFTNKWLKERVQ